MFVVLALVRQGQVNLHAHVTPYPCQITEYKSMRNLSHNILKNINAYMHNTQIQMNTHIHTQTDIQFHTYIQTVLQGGLT